MTLNNSQYTLARAFYKNEIVAVFNIQHLN